MDLIGQVMVCSNCGRMPLDGVGRCEPTTLCGIPVSANYGPYLYCSCGNRTKAYSLLNDAIAEWDRMQVKILEENGGIIMPKFSATDYVSENARKIYDKLCEAMPQNTPTLLYDDTDSDSANEFDLYELLETIAINLDNTETIKFI